MASPPSVCHDDIQAASTVLVFDSPFDSPTEATCPFLCDGTTAETQSALSVLFTGSPTEYFRAWTQTAGRRADQLQIISANPGSAPTVETDSPPVIERVTNPGNLTALGVAITNAVSTQDCDTGEMSVCFDSLTSLLQYSALDRTVRFLRELSNQFDAVGARAHVHVDPKAHDKQTIGTLVSQFDEVIELGDSQPRYASD